MKTFRVLVSALTGVGLAGILVTFVGARPIGGCGAGLAAVLLLFVLVILAAIALIGALASIGLIFLWRGSVWGPILLIPANLLVVGFYGFWTPVGEGQLAWGIAVLALAATPAVACLLLVWPLLSRGRAWARLVEVVVVVALTVLLLPIYAHGVAYDVNMAAMPRPAPVVTTGPPLVC